MIHKYTIDFNKPMQYVEMPDHARILSCQAQYGQIRLWALVNEKAPIVKRLVRIVATGQNVNDNADGRLEFVDTVQLHGGDLVLHVFVAR